LTGLPALSQFDGADGDLATAVRGNTRRYMALFAEAADELMPVATELHEEDDVFDVLMRQVRRPPRPAAPAGPCDALTLPVAPQREAAEAETAAADAAAGGGPHRANAAQQLPPALRRRYRVCFKPSLKADVKKLREVRAGEIGKVVTVKARACKARLPASAHALTRTAPAHPAGHRDARGRREAADGGGLLHLRRLRL
jgi:DNA replicative helicase MCM subunit Mcm2 (Cdc46/Mcm family)